MAIKFDLQITATSIADFKKQIKTAYENLFGPVVETPKEPVSAEVVTEKAPEPEIEVPKEKVRKKRTPFRGPCKACGTTTTPLWRMKSLPEGPLCNRCGIVRIKELKAQAENKPTESNKERSVRIRAEKMVTSVRGKKTTTPKRAEKKFVPAPKEEVQLTAGTYLTWCEQNVPGIIMRDRAYLVATNVIETWFNGLKAQFEFINWMLENQEEYVTATRKVFEAFQATLPTVFMIQDANDNIVLMINKPNSLNMKELNKVNWE